jgi:LysR family glycine cleavage system transcriptional activator
VRLTETGRQLATGVSQGIGIIEEAVAEARSPRQAVLAVTAMHSFAARWLVPRLHLFNERHPDIQVLVAASDTPVDLVRDRYDVAIRFGRGPTRLRGDKLVSLFMFPSAARGFLGTDAAATRRTTWPTASCSPTCYLAQGEPHWSDWLALAGAPEVDWRRGQQFSNVYLAIEAAMAGRGVALAERALGDRRAGLRAAGEALRYRASQHLQPVDPDAAREGRPAGHPQVPQLAAGPGGCRRPAARRVI